MTLNITLLSADAVFQSGDFILIDTATAKPRPYLSQKAILVQRSTWTALVAFSGIGSVGTLQVADWLATETGLDSLPFDAELKDLFRTLATAESWMRRVPSPVDRRHTFSVAGFDHAKHFVALVSNWQALDAADGAATSTFRITRASPKGVKLLLSGSGRDSVSQESKDRLIGSLRSGRKSTEKMLELIASVNGDVSKVNSTVSAGCFVSWTGSGGSGGGKPFGLPDDKEYIPKFALPGGIRLQPQMNPDGTAQPIRLVQMATQRSDRTLAFHKSQIAASPRDANAWNNYGAHLLDVQHDVSSAEAAFRRAIDLNPNNCDATGNLANIFKTRGELDEAQDLYERALRIDPKNSAVRRNFAQFLTFSRNDPKAANDIYERGLELQPDNSLLKEGLSQIPNRKSYLAAIDEAPDSPNPYNNYGVYLDCVEGDGAAAEEAYRRALELDPDHVNALGNLGIRIWRTGDLNAAETMLRRAVELRPDDIVHRNNLGEFLRDGRDSAEMARAVYEEGLTITPDSRTLQEGFASVSLAV